MKTLPLASPPIAACLFHAYPLSILAQDTRYLPWLYNTHIQLFSFPGEDLGFYNHPFSTSREIRHLYHQTCPLLDAQAIDRNTLNPNPADLLSWTKTLIDQGYYVQLDVDFFHLPNKPHYLRRHFIREMLVAGYDDAKKMVWTSDYDAQGLYDIMPLPYDRLTQAISWNKEHHMRRMQRSAHHRLPWLASTMADRPRVHLYKYRPERDCLLDLTCIAEQLSDYLTGRNSAERCRLATRPRHGGAWGIHVYQDLQEQIQGWPDDPSTFSPTAWSILWEHKKCMYERICYLEGKGLLAEDLAPEALDIAQRANALRPLLRRRGPQPAIAAPAALLESIANDEYALLHKLLHQL